jgi:hypothetical protein
MEVNLDEKTDRTRHDYKERMMFTAQAERTALERSVEQQISQRTWGRVHRLHVEMANGRLIVHGNASSYYAKQLALEGAMDALGLTDATTVELDIHVANGRRNARHVQHHA